MVNEPIPLRPLAGPALAGSPGGRLSAVDAEAVLDAYS